MTATIGVVVAQLGTPAAPTAQALRPYLKQFLSDRRVIDYHPLLWQPILRGIILRTRPSKSAQKYQRIWLTEGSPLLVYSERQVAGLQARLGSDFQVELGMTYGEPSMSHAIEKLEAAGINRIVVLSMFPQYSSTTSAAVYDAVYQAAAGRPNARKRAVPTLNFVEPYYTHSDYLGAVVGRMQQAIEKWGKSPQKIVFSFHGIPNRYLKTGDPYREQCEQTACLLAEKLGLAPDQWLTSFQSQFGPEKWLEPYTDQVLTKLPQQGVERVVVVCPGFTADCLETLDELGNEGREQFEAGGGHGENYLLVPCLNDDPAWLDAMATLVQNAALGWTVDAVTKFEKMPLTQF